ncbi:MAG: flavodoxin family protein [Candidatus Omnitrophota bacterium]
MNMKALGINASARKNGNCAILLTEALKGAKEQGADTEVVFLDELKISAWREKLPKDDMNALLAKIKSADAIILASPIYFGSLSAQAKIMIDRCQGLWVQKEIKKQKIRQNKAQAAFICAQAADKKEFFQNATQIAKNFFAVIEAEYKEELFCVGLEKAGDAHKHPEFLKAAYTLGGKIV